MKYLSRLVFIFLLLSLSSSMIYAQGGMRAFSGLSQLSTRDLSVTPEGTSHRGFHVGLDACFAGEGMYFIVGGMFSRLPLAGSEDGNFFSPIDDFSSTALRVGLGFKLFEISEVISIRSRVVGSFDILNRSSASPVSDPAYQVINDGFGALIGGLGVQFWVFELDVEYRYGVFNLYNKQKDTVLDGYALSLGVRF